jgi:hypothetical protein
MKKLFILLVLIPFTAAAQTTKEETIFTGVNCTMNSMLTLVNDSITSAYVTCEAKDDRLPTLKNFFTICYDTPQNIYKFLTELEKFASDNSSKSAEIGKHKVEIDSSTGSRLIKVFDERGVMFHRFTPKLITSIRTSLGEWAGTNKIILE